MSHRLPRNHPVALPTREGTQTTVEASYHRPRSVGGTKPTASGTSTGPAPTMTRATALRSPRGRPRCPSRARAGRRRERAPAPPAPPRSPGCARHSERSAHPGLRARSPQPRATTTRRQSRSAHNGAAGEHARRAASQLHVRAHLDDVGPSGRQRNQSERKPVRVHEIGVARSTSSRTREASQKERQRQCKLGQRRKLPSTPSP
jgi:hypothetical protein